MWILPSGMTRNTIRFKCVDGSEKKKRSVKKNSQGKTEREYDEHKNTKTHVKRQLTKDNKENASYKTTTQEFHTF